MYDIVRKKLHKMASKHYVLYLRKLPATMYTEAWRNSLKLVQCGAWLFLCSISWFLYLKSGQSYWQLRAGVAPSL